MLCCRIADVRFDAGDFGLERLDPRLQARRSTAGRGPACRARSADPWACPGTGRRGPWRESLTRRRAAVNKRGAVSQPHSCNHDGGRSAAARRRRGAGAGRAAGAAARARARCWSRSPRRASTGPTSSSAAGSIRRRRARPTSSASKSPGSGRGRGGRRGAGRAEGLRLGRRRRLCRILRRAGGHLPAGARRAQHGRGRGDARDPVHRLGQSVRARLCRRRRCGAGPWRHQRHRDDGDRARQIVRADGDRHLRIGREMRAGDRARRCGGDQLPDARISSRR